ncbi:MAG: lipoate--protein ligase family protein [Chlorobiaceae bacterium]|nr:lipoate--protein ligase family protein [Chlorobiaceae bacterium]
MNSFFSKVYCVDTGFGSGEENMALDRQLMNAFLEGRFQKKYDSGSSLWRFYAWHPFAVTLGYNQDSSAIDAGKCVSAGIDIVRRPTGGRAVFHADEFTYSFFADSPAQNAELYRMVHEVIRLALEGLGIHAGFCRSTLSEQKGAGLAGSVSCFTASAKYELQVEGRKLVGSAQRRSRNVLLQHGSLPLTGRHKELGSLVAVTEEDECREIGEEMERKAISLEEILGYVPEYNRLAELMLCALGEHSGCEVIVLQPGELKDILDARENFIH